MSQFKFTNLHTSINHQNHEMTFFIILNVLLVFPLLSQNVAIPDTAFLYELIDVRVENNNDSLISYTEAEVVKNINLFKKNIHELTGVEAFTNLESLECFFNQFTYLDISNNTRFYEG